MAKKPANKMLRQYLDADALDLAVPGTNVADASAPTAYSAHSSGATPVTSNAATDLDTTAAAVATLRSEVATLTTKFNALLASLETAKVLSAS